MKILLDENIPVKLKRSLPQEHLWMTVRELGWQGTKNGKLLKQMVSEGFEGLIRWTGIYTSSKTLLILQYL